MKKNDIILLSIILVAAIIAVGILSLIYAQSGEVAVVRVDGVEYARLPLNKDTELLIEGVGGTNLLVIKDGKACVTEATCPDLVCVHTGYANEIKPIACRPNKVSVTIEKNK